MKQFDSNGADHDRDNRSRYALREPGKQQQNRQAEQPKSECGASREIEKKRLCSLYA
jgi:hypothetical protein